MKKIIFAITAIVASQVVMADWLMWQVCESDFIDLDNFDEVVSVRVGYVTAGNDVNYGSGTLFETYYTAGGEMFAAGELPTYVADGNRDDTGYAFKVNLGEITSPSSYSYYIELLNSSDEAIGRTAAGTGYKYATYSSLSGSVASGDIGVVPQATIWHGGTFEAVPEPSSMALLALGAGLVGLRRKLKKGKKAQKEKRA